MKKTKGITLIALIITIIILLILTGVTMNIAVNGGLFNNAQRAVDDTNAKVSNTQNRVDELSGVLSNIAESTGEHNWNRTGDNLECSHCGLSLMIGDYLDYTPDTTSKTVTITSTESGYDIDQTFSQEMGKYWKVLGIEDGDRNGTNETLLIKMVDPTETVLTLYGAQAYNNGPDIMNRICKELYSSSKYGEARSINIDDINNCLQYTPGGGMYEDDKYNEYETNGFNIQAKELPRWDIIKESGTNTPDGTNTEEKLGSYNINGYEYDYYRKYSELVNPVSGVIIEISKNSELTVFGFIDKSIEGYWLACRGVYQGVSSIMFGPGMVLYHSVHSYSRCFFNNSVGSWSSRARVCPTVSLKGEIPEKISGPVLTPNWFE